MVVSRLYRKRGLLAVSLLVSVVLGAYAALNYEWSVEYTIEPLTSPTWTIIITSTSGATIGGDSGTLDDAVTVTKALSKLHFKINVTSALKSQLEGSFYKLTLELTVSGQTVKFKLVENGVASETVYDKTVGPLSVGTYDVSWSVSYRTKALSVSTSNSFGVEIYAEEQ